MSENNTQVVETSEPTVTASSFDNTSELEEYRKRKKAYKFKETPKSVRVLFNVLKYIILIGACLLVILPLLVVLIGSFKTHDEYITTNVFALPSEPQFSNFVTAFVDGDVMHGLLNTAIILLISCTGTIITGTMTAFVLQRFNSLFTRAVKAVFLVAALLPNISMQVTVFQVINSLGLYNSIWAPCILYIGTDIVSIYIFIQFLNNISRSLDESAFLDGASYFRIYWSIILPMLRPAIATVLVIKFVGIYNDFYTANLYMPSKDLGVVSTALYRFIGPYGAKWEIIFAGIIICIIPTLIIFITLQKFIYSNLVAGSVKE